MTEHNNTPIAPRAKRQLKALLHVLQTLDVEAFRAVTGADDMIPDDVLLRAIHKARLEHPGINRSQKQASRRYLAGDRT